VGVWGGNGAKDETHVMPEGVAQRRDLLFLLSLLPVILMYPVMDYDLAGKLIIALLTFVPLIFATIKLSQKTILVMAICAPGFRCSGLHGFEFHPSQSSLRSGDMGNTDGFLCTNSGWIFLLPDGRPRHHGCTSLYGCQHLLVTGHAMVCAVFRDRGNPHWLLYAHFAQRSRGN
jgi:hypothetical protein